MKPNMLDTNGLGKNSKNTDRVMIMKEQSSAFKAKEYEMLRAEILQYMEEYQTVRNMMYVVTATILSITSGLWKNYYLFLLPLVVILPGYIIYFKYMKSVLVASIYMQVFLENDDIGDTYRWESRHDKFSRNCHEKHMRGVKGWVLSYAQRIPYYMCALVCLTLFGVNVAITHCGASVISVHGIFDLLLFICVIAVCGFELWVSGTKK